MVGYGCNMVLTFIKVIFEKNRVSSLTLSLAALVTIPSITCWTYASSHCVSLTLLQVTPPHHPTTEQDQPAPHIMLHQSDLHRLVLPPLDGIQSNIDGCRELPVSFIILNDFSQRLLKTMIPTPFTPVQHLGSSC